MSEKSSILHENKYILKTEYDDLLIKYKAVLAKNKEAQKAIKRMIDNLPELDKLYKIKDS